MVATMVDIFQLLESDHLRIFDILGFSRPNGTGGAS